MARAEPISQHGWFPDPEEPGRLRMWDGKAWTSLTKYPSAEDVVSGPAPAGPLPSTPIPRAAPPPRPAPRPAAAPPAVEPAMIEPADASVRTVIATNGYSVLTLGISVICILVASSTGLVVIGLVPVLLAGRALSVREPMAPLATLAAAAAVIVGLLLLAK